MDFEITIEFAPLTDADIERIHEIREAGAIGAAAPEFRELPAKIQAFLTARKKIVGKAALVNGARVGWVFISPKPELQAIHVGFALFPEFRGKGLMKPIVADRIARFLTEEFPAMEKSFPQRTLTAITDPANAAAIKTLEACGFKFSSREWIPFGPDPDSQRHEALVFKLAF